MNKPKTYWKNPLFYFLFCFPIILLANPKKVALIVAIGEYAPQSGWNQLGAANDAFLLQKTLLQQGFQENNIILLKNKNATKTGIIQAIEQTLLQKITKGDIVFFHFSGHGQQVADNNHDEIDGYDEAIVPYDSPKYFQKEKYEGNNLIRDEDLGHLLNKVRKKLGKSGHLLCLIDACHSGTALRGETNTRGTDIIMADENYIQKHPKKLSNINEPNALQLEKPLKNKKSYAPMITFFSTRADQPSYEHTDESGTTYGSLSYAFCKAISLSNSNTTYAGLFNKVRKTFVGYRFEQTPEAEGPMNLLVFGNQTVSFPKYANYLNFINGKIHTFNKGTFHNWNMGAEVILVPADTRTPSQKNSIAQGHIINATPFQCEIELKQALNKKEITDLWAFQAAPNYGKLSLAIKLNFSQDSLHKMLYDLVQDFPTIQIVKQSPDLILTNTPKALIIKSIDNNHLFSQPIPTLDIFHIRQQLMHFAQAKFLRQLDIEDPFLKIDLAFLTESETPLENNPKFKTGDTFKLKISNKGKRNFYFCLIDIQPDNQLNCIIPWNGRPKEDYFLKGGKEVVFESSLTVYPPTGTEIYKLIASQYPIDLEQLICNSNQSNREKLRSTNQLHPLEILLLDTYLDTSQTRGGNTENIPIGQTAVKTIVFEITE